MVSTSLSEIHGSGSQTGGMRQSEWEYELFRRRFVKTREAVFKVAQYLNLEKNLTVRIPAMELAPSVGVSTDYSDQGDIFCHKTLVGVMSPESHIIEVKQRSFNFTSSDDYPYEDGYVMIAQKVNCDRLDSFAYFIVNQSMTHAFVIKTSTKDQWKAEDIYDRERKNSQITYLAHKSLGEFIKL